LAEELNMALIAEGVENSEQAWFLLSAGCKFAQEITDGLMLPGVTEQFAKIAVEPLGGSVAETTKIFAAEPEK
jgi:hypothetical protein